MALAFRSVAIPGTHGPLQISPWGVQVARTQYFGVEGESEITGERTGRDIVVESWWHASYVTAAALQTAIDNFNKDVPINGTLVEAGNVNRTFDRCTLMGAFIKQGPIPPSTIGWFAIVEIRWRQLAP